MCFRLEEARPVEPLERVGSRPGVPGAGAWEPRWARGDPRPVLSHHTGDTSAPLH